MKKILAACFGVLFLLPTAAQAQEGSATLSAQCEWKGSVSCEATCNPTASYFQCDIDPPECSGKVPTQCSAELEAAASCDLQGCTASCEARCTANPPSFSCTSECQAKLEAECVGKIDANCQSRCASDVDKATCESSCKSELQATCKGTGSASCDAQCTGTKGTADCKGTCEASCKGSCNAQAKARATCDGYLSCKSEGVLKCQTDFKANCKSKCETSGGALVCNGQVVTYGDLNAVKAWFEQHGYATGSSSASCSGNTCQAQAEGEAGVSCAASSAPIGSGMPAALGLLAFGYAASRLRRKRS
jgi:MYXO-CTERM domain-containing protein